VPDSTSDNIPNDPNTDVMIGNCPAMQEVYRSIGRVARQDVTVLILGESGTGKEVIARALYQYSSRPHGRFLAINCAAIPEQLLESELFGHEKGAFTGAETKRIGKFELCNEGTLFLDEIGDMTPLMQTKILRVLQDQTFERVGGSQTIRTTARIIAATNRNLEKAIEDKEFRSDLYYRLNVYTIKLPALRDRGDDISLLASYFVRRFARELGKEISGISTEAMKILKDYHWPGNVRELQSLIKHALLQSTGPVIVPAFLPDFLKRKESQSLALVPDKQSANSNGLDFADLTRQRLEAGSDDIHRELISLAEQRIFAEVLKHTAGNLTQAAKRLGITRSTLRTRLEALGITLGRTTTLEM
jgi:two-component system nitrogen regulation response regulator GlnG